MWSVKIVVIREMRSSVARVQLVNRFQGGSSLRARKRSNQRTRDHWIERETDGIRITSKTSEISGRKWGSRSQQRWVIIHKFSVKVGCVGRGGRRLCIIANVAMGDESSLKGIAPVNTYVDTK